jgi:hypothetical protein
VSTYDGGVRRPRISLPTLAVLVAVGVVVWLVMRPTVLSVAVAVLAGWLIFRVGYAVLRALATPPPEPPPPGELRQVRITYRCSICGTEVRMTAATEEFPEPPRHCQEDMDLVAPIE